MSLEEAIRLVQVHERARQGRLRAKFMREIRLEEEREKLAATRGAPTLDPDVAATRIQKVFSFSNFSEFCQQSLRERQRIILKIAQSGKKSSLVSVWIWYNAKGNVSFTRHGRT